MAVFAHPDDPEVACAGTLARWSRAGSEVHLVICNAGEKGSFDPGAAPDTLARDRAAEADAAADVMGLGGHRILGHPDGEIENTNELRGELVACLRTVRPDVVISPDPTAVFFGDSYVNHHDHRVVGWAVLDACAPMAGSPLYFPDAGAAHQVGSILLAGTLDPDTWVDIGAVLDVKVAALRCHRSQLGDGSEVVADVVRRRAAEAGRTAGVDYAEGFRRLTLGG